MPARRLGRGRVDGRTTDEAWRGRRTAWRRCRRWLFIVAVVALALLAAERLTVGFHALLVANDPHAAMDLLSRRAEVRAWFVGEPVYGHIESARYPPATYAMLWPLLAWTTPMAARYLWAIVVVASSAALIALLLRAAEARSVETRLLVVLTVASSQALSYSLAVGQLTVPTVALALAGVVLACRRPSNAVRQAGAALLLLAALVKPTLTAPLFWVALLAAANPAAGLAAGGGYALVTLVAARFQALPLPALIAAWLAANRTAGNSRGYGDLESWLRGSAVDSWIPAVSLLLLAALGGWMWRHRRRDPWWLMAVCAVVARVWTYHQLYDDILVLVPMAYLLRIVGDEKRSRRRRFAAGAALLFAWLPFLAPARFLLLPMTAEGVLDGVRTASWLLMLGVLLAAGTSSRRPGEIESGA
jgi:Glycosyltransferase family 87